MDAIAIGVGVLVIVLTALALVVAVARLRFARMVGAHVDRLLAGAPAVPATPRADLPPLASRWLGGLPTLPSPVASARLEQTGAIRLAPGKPWMALHAEQFISLARPGFVWHARVNLAPLVWFEVRDFYSAQRGGVLGRLESLLTVVRLDGHADDVARASLLRWLAEVVWVPPAFNATGAAGLQIEPLDERHARIRVRDGELEAAATLEFGDDGLPARLRAQRPRDIGGGKSVLTGWRGEYRDWRDLGAGFRVPVESEVVWELPAAEGGDFAYCRIRIEHLELGAARPELALS